MDAGVRQVLEQREGREEPLAGSRLRVEAGSAALLAVVAAILVAVAPPREAPWALVLLLVGLLAVLSRIELEVGKGALVPTQLAFVPLALLAPPSLVVPATVAGYVLGALHGAGPLARRLVLAVSSSWFAVGPAVVMLALGPPRSASAAALLTLPVVAAQIACDVAGWALDARISGGGRPTLHDAAWLYAFDLVLTPLGLCGALAAREARPAVVLPAATLALLLIVRRERSARFTSLEELSQAYRRTALLLADVVEADDAYTGEHSVGVVGLARGVAVEHGLPEHDVRQVELAALLHDVGKIRVPNEILRKPGALTEEEWDAIHGHPATGAAMLERIGGTLAAIAPAVRHHHERWDGGGYPDGLAGPDIPLAARIVAVCDAWDAMTTDRPYRDALPREDALAELARGAGAQWDPAVVQSLLVVLGEAGAADRVA